MRRAAVPLLALGLFACGDDEAPSEGLDHTRVFETKTHALQHVDMPFRYEVPTLFRTTDVLAELDVRALRFVGGRLHAGTATSVQVFDRDANRFAPHADPRAAGIGVVDLAELDGRLVVAGEREVRVLGEPPLSAPFASRVSSVDVAAGTLWIGTAAGLWRWQPPAAPAKIVDRLAVRDVAVLAGVVNAASIDGVVRYDVATATTVASLRAPAQLADDDVTALAVSGNELIAGSKTGIARIGGTTARITKAARGGLPTGDVTAIVEREGLVLLGHEIGATAVGERTDHYHSRRWIPAQRVNAVAIGEGGTRWIATSEGVSRIAFESTTLAERAERFEAMIEARHWRMDGFVDDDTNLLDAWKPDEGFVHDDKDNDGLWTQMQIGPWCMAYAETGDERYYQRARKALDTMFMLIDLPAMTFEAMGKKRGYIARSLVREDEGEIYESKKTNPQWIPVEYQGKKYFWKSDTSSDEYAGHFFGYPLFYDLCAKTAEEKKAIADRMATVADYLIDGGYQLIDLDGMKTTHGHWNDQAAAIIAPNDCGERFPLELCLSSLGGGGWLNGMEILGHLLATWHMTGDQKYYDEYEKLYTEHRYGDMVPLRETTVTVTDPAIANHSDHELALLAYFTLLRYEPNEGRRQRLRQSIVDFQAYEKRERNPWSLSVVASGVSLEDNGADPGGQLDDAIRTLHEWPEDWRTWKVTNAHRADADRWPLDRHSRPQLDVVFPYDEIRTMKWNGNPYAVEGGGNGKSVLVPTPWLIAYWKLRYFGVIP